MLMGTEKDGQRDRHGHEDRDRPWIWSSSSSYSTDRPTWGERRWRVLRKTRPPPPEMWTRRVQSAERHLQDSRRTETIRELELFAFGRVGVWFMALLQWPTSHRETRTTLNSQHWLLTGTGTGTGTDSDQLIQIPSLIQMGQISDTSSTFCVTVELLMAQKEQN